MRTLESFEDLWRLRWPNPRGDRRLTSPNTIRSKGAPPYWFASGRHSDTRSRRARRTWLTVWSPTAVCCFYVNNSTARRFYYHIEHVHGGRREFHGRVKKTTSSLETASVKSRMEGIDSTLPSRICCRQLTNRETRVWAHGSPQCLLSINAWCWINKNSLRLSYIIIHSKYFPDPDWLKARV